MPTTKKKESKPCSYRFFDAISLACATCSEPHFVVLVDPERRPRVIAELVERGTLSVGEVEKWKRSPWATA